MAAPTAEQINLRIYASLGDVPGAERIAVDYTESSSTEGNQVAVIPLEFAASEANTSLDLSDFVDTATIIAVIDRGGTGIDVGHSNTGTKVAVAANGPFVFKNRASTPPTLYFTNPSGSDKAFILVAVMGSSAA